MLKKSVIGGLVAAIIYLLWLVIIVKTQLISRNDLTLLPILIPVLLVGFTMFFFVRQIRMSVYYDEINYGQCFYSGVLISLFMSLFIGLFLVILESAHVLVPELIDNMKQISRLNLEIDKKTPEEIEGFLKQLDAPFTIAINSFINYLLIGVFLSTIVALFVRNKDTFTSHLTEEEKK